MSFQTQLKAHFASAKADRAADFVAVDAKADASVAELEKVVGPLTGPLSAKTVEDAFEAAVQRGIGESQLGSLLAGFVRGSISFEEIVGPVNDKAKLGAIVDEARTELVELRAQLADPAALQQIIGVLPEAMKAGRSEADVTLIATEVRDYAAAIVDEVSARIEGASSNSDTVRDRAIGLSRLRAAGETFRDYHQHQKAFEPLKTFDFAGTIELDLATRAKHPALAAAVDAVGANDLPDEIIYRAPVGLNFEADKNDPSALNQAAWATFGNASATADKLKEALRISLFSVRITAGKNPTVLDTAACLAARLGQADLAREANAAATAIDANAANDSTTYLADIATGAAKPVQSAAEIAVTYPALVASCESAHVDAPKEPVMLEGLFGMSYEADFTDADHLNRMAWGLYEEPNASAESLRDARAMAAVACSISQYTHAAALDTLACIDHRLGQLDSGREAMRRAIELDPGSVTEGAAKLYV